MKKVKLGDVCDVFAGQGAPQGNEKYCHYDSGIPFIKAGDLGDLMSGKSERELQCVDEAVAKECKLKLYQAGSVLFAKSGMSCMKGYVYCTKEPCYVVSHLAIITPKKVEKEYLKHYFQYYKPNTLVKDSAYPSISLSDIANMEILLPSIEEQKEIADRLDKVVGLIEKRKEQLAKLDQLVKSRFIEMFGDISQADKNSFVSMDSFCTISSSKRVHVADYVNSGIPFYRSKEIIELGENKNPSVELFISREHYEAIKQKNYIPQKNDILMSAVGTIGKMWIVDGIREFYYKDGNILCIHSDSTNAIYLKFALSMLIDDFKDGNVGGSAYSALTIVKLNKMLVPLPPISLQNSFAEFVKQIEKSKFDIQQSIDKLETLKKSLMQQYFG